MKGEGSGDWVPPCPPPLIRLFCSIKRKNVQISKFVLGSQAKLKMENG